MPSSDDIIGLDLGKSRTGLARVSQQARLAEPLYSLPTKQLPAKLKSLGAKSFVVGLPRNLSGEDTNQTKWVRRWTEATKQQMPQTIFYFQDEALSSRLAFAHGQKLKKAFDEDALAAAIILQDFIDTPEAERVIC